jgi:hypothetical protein
MVSEKISSFGTGGDYGRTEYAYHRMATQAGIVMSPCRLLEENDRAHFMTRRFDRDVVQGKTIKQHVQTLCAMNHLDYKQRGTHAYSQLFMTVSELGLGDDAIQRRQELLGDVRSALDNWTEHAKAAGLSPGKTDELRGDFLLI